MSRKTHKKFYFLLTISILLSINFSYAQTTTSTTTQLDVCRALNSLNLYSKTNFQKIQLYIRQNIFPKLLATGLNDSQTKYYLQQFQYSYGLSITGSLNEPTLKYLKKLNNCFDLGDRVMRTETNAIKRKDDQANLIITILREQVYASSTSTSGLQNFEPVTVKSIMQ